MSQLLLNVMGSFAEFERALILERKREGIAVAKVTATPRTTLSEPFCRRIGQNGRPFGSTLGHSLQ
ncbi:hypothetical protein BRAO285_2000012 [Bradyrhizobium sp. ORS 285]|nr:hypothetical protein BRAO285_2000012 [Bradyrhizobium sp. ORS 285]